jgi:hypothetical protein
MLRAQHPRTHLHLLHLQLFTAITPKNIKARWIKAGLYPLNPDKVLRDIQKPLAELTVRKPDETKGRFSLQDEVLQTPVTAEHVTALHSLIEQDARTLDETSKKRLQKLANAAKLSFAECALLQDENQFLFKQNDEAKRRRSTNQRQEDTMVATRGGTPSEIHEESLENFGGSASARTC